MATLTLLIQNVAVALLILVVAWFLGGQLEVWLERAFVNSRVDPALRKLAVRVVRPLVLTLAALSALERLGVSNTSFVAVFAAAAFAVGLAFRGSLANVAAGAWLLTLRPFNEGDLVEAGGVRGTLRDLGLMQCTLEAEDGAIVTVPNQILVSAALHNHTRKGLRRLTLSASVPIATDVTPVLERFAALAAQDPDVHTALAPVAEVGEIGVSAVRLDLHVWVAPDKAAALRARLHLAMLSGLRNG